MLFVTSPRLASYALVGIPLAVLPIVVGGRRLKKISRASQDRIADANALAAETLGAVRTVQAHAREPYEQGRFGERAEGRGRHRAPAASSAQAWVTAVAIMLIFGAITLVLWIGRTRRRRRTHDRGHAGPVRAVRADRRRLDRRAGRGVERSCSAPPAAWAASAELLSEDPAITRARASAVAAAAAAGRDRLRRA